MHRIPIEFGDLKMKIKTKNATLLEKYTIKKWIKKWAKELENLKFYDIHTTILDKTDDKWTGDVYVQGQRCFITMERPITEKVLHHELYHIHMERIFRPQKGFQQPFLNFDDCDINHRTRQTIIHLHYLLEEWFTELNTFQHLHQNREKAGYARKYLGQPYKQYLNDLNFNFLRVDFSWFNNLNSVLENTMLDNGLAYINLFRHALLWDNEKLPSDFKRCQSISTAKRIAKMLQNYRDLEKLDTNYVTKLLSDFLNIIGEHHPTVNGPIVTIKPGSIYNDLIFTPQFKIVVKKFDDGMAAVDRNVDWIISQIKHSILNRNNNFMEMFNTIYPKFCKIEGKKAARQFEGIFLNLYREIMPG